MAWRKYKVNELFFDAQSQDSAYVAGWIAGDGSITYGKDAKIYLMGSHDEYSHLRSMADRMGSSHEVRLYKNKSSGVQIGSQRLVSGLTQGFGLEKHLGVIKVPSLQEEFVRSFVRGYFDADGWCFRNPQGHLRAGLSGVSKVLMEFVAEWVRGNLGLGRLREIRPRECNWKSVWSLDLFGTSTLKFMDLISSHPGELFHPRKWILFNNLCREKAPGAVLAHNQKP